MAYTNRVQFSLIISNTAVYGLSPGQQVASDLKDSMSFSPSTIPAGQLINSGFQCTIHSSRNHTKIHGKKKKKKATPAASIPLSQKIKEFPETWVDLIPMPLWQQLRDLRDTGNITSLTNVRVHISYEEQNKILYFIPTSGTQVLLSLPFLQQLFKPINITEALHCAKF